MVAKYNHVSSNSDFISYEIPIPFFFFSGNWGNREVRERRKGIWRTCIIYSTKAVTDRGKLDADNEVNILLSGIIMEGL